MNHILVRSLGFLTLLLATSCGRSAGLGAEPGPPGPTVYDARIQYTCAPNDGTALRLIIGESQCDGSDATGEKEHFQVYLWKDLPESGDFSYVPDDGPGMHCPGGIEFCDDVDGQLHFDIVDPTVEALGSFEFQLIDGAPRAGTFEARWCDSGMIRCG